METTHEPQQSMTKETTSKQAPTQNVDADPMINLSPSDVS